MESRGKGWQLFVMMLFFGFNPSAGDASERTQKQLLRPKPIQICAICECRRNGEGHSVGWQYWDVYAESPQYGCHVGLEDQRSGCLDFQDYINRTVPEHEAKWVCKLRRRVR